MTNSDLHLAVLNGEVGMPNSRNHAGRQANTNAARIIDGLLRNGDHFVERPALRRLGRSRFPHQNLTGNAAPLGLIAFRSRRHVIVGNDRPDRDALAFGHGHRHLHIHVIAGIVPVKAGHARTTIGGAHGVKKTFRGRGRKNLADRNGIHHAVADIAEKRRLVPGTAARNDADLAGFGRLYPLDDAQVIDASHSIGMRRLPAFEHVLDHKICIVDDSVHRHDRHLYTKKHEESQYAQLQRFSSDASPPAKQSGRRTFHLERSHAHRQDWPRFPRHRR